MVKSLKNGLTIYLRNGLLLSGVLILTIGSAIAAGRLDNRWGEPPDLLEAGRKLETLPQEFGSWQCQSTQAVDADVVEILQCTGSLNQVYRNVETGDVVQVAIFVGRPGPISVHTPEVCYSLAGHRPLEASKRFKLRDSDPDERQFFGATFIANTVDGGVLRVAHAWNAGRGWRAPDRPRLAFGGAPFLYKVQVATSVATRAELADHDPCRDFLRDFVPVADRHLFLN